MLHENLTPLIRNQDLLANWLQQQTESIGVVKIWFVGRMTYRPVRESVDRLDDRREADAKSGARVGSGQAIEPDQGVELEPIAGRAHCNLRAYRFVRYRTTVAIAAEGVDGPLSRRREVELVIGRLPVHRDEGLEAGMAP